MNILMVIAGWGSVQVPLYWELLDNKSGSSSTVDRIDLLQRCLQLLGKDRIGLGIGDWEFVGHQWMKYLKDNNLLFVMRLPKHHLMHQLDGQSSKITDLAFQAVKPRLFKDCMVDGVWGNIWVQELRKV